MKPTKDDILIEVRGLKTHFFTDEGVSPAVDGVDYSVKKGETLGVVGESGCGKSVTAQSIMRFIPEPPGRIVHGKILFDGTDVVPLSMEQMRSIRGNRIAMIFQEPMTSLNPVYRVGEQIVEGMLLHLEISKPEARQRTIDLMAS